MYRDSPVMKCLVSVAKMLIALENNVPATLHTTLNVTNSVNKRKPEIKAHLLMQPCHFGFLLSLWALFSWLMVHTTSKCNDVPGELYWESLLCQKSHTYSFNHNLCKKEYKLLVFYCQCSF